jgi:hypothetical protein
MVPSAQRHKNRVDLADAGDLGNGLGPAHRMEQARLYREAPVFRYLLGAGGCHAPPSLDPGERCAGWKRTRRPCHVDRNDPSLTAHQGMGQVQQGIGRWLAVIEKKDCSQGHERSEPPFSTCLQA